MTNSPLDNWKDQPGRMRGIVEDAIDRRVVLLGCLMHDITARVAVAGEAWKVAARHF
jgi:hypothetical protein